MFNLYGTAKNVYYQLRPIFITDDVPIFQMSSQDNSKTGSVLISLPLFAVISGINIEDLMYEKLVIKFKDPDNLNNIEVVKNNIKN
jgi:hypothetical protein